MAFCMNNGHLITGLGRREQIQLSPEEVRLKRLRLAPRSPEEMAVQAQLQETYDNEEEDPLDLDNL